MTTGPSAPISLRREIDRSTMPVHDLILEAGVEIVREVGRTQCQRRGAYSALRPRPS